MNKEYRVDTFIGKSHKKNYFDEKEKALIFAGKESAKGKNVFLLKHIIDGKYNLVEKIK